MAWWVLLVGQHLTTATTSVAKIWTWLVRIWFLVFKHMYSVGSYLMCAGRGCLCSKGRRTQKECRGDLDCLVPWRGFCIRFRLIVQQHVDLLSSLTERRWSPWSSRSSLRLMCVAYKWLGSSPSLLCWSKVSDYHLKKSLNIYVFR